MKVKAILKKFQCSPKKTRLVVDKIRGLNAEEAAKSLMFINKKASDPILKLLKSCISNAEHNFNLDKKDLVIKEIRVDSDGMYKRYTPKARGVATPVLKRLSKVEIILEGKEKEEVKIKKVKEEKVGDGLEGKVKEDKKETKKTDKKESTEKKVNKQNKK